MGIRTGYDAVVLAGGAARRLGGADKPALRVGGTTLLDRVLDACAGAGATVVVGPRRHTLRPVRWTRESPPGGGPLPALAAGLRHTSAELVLVLAADLPFLTPATVAALLDAVSADADGAVLVDPEGIENPLVAAYRAAGLRRELDLLVEERGALDGLPLRRLTARLELRRLPDPGGLASFDCDTWDALDTARARIREHGHVLDEWIAAAKAELGIDLDVDTATLLDLARDAAHGVARPAAPLTTFLVGYAAAGAGGGPEAVAEATRKAAELARRWAAESTGNAGVGENPGGTAADGGSGEHGAGTSAR
ncbi:NTP transferase domain-containing protein [Streptantibioticus ferralitis]|uniref:NTP transferase domain-containing protein n=1 Tax=Streptantibioticus ferralitis TaxID=236510 RepID=A0ABT5ZAD6_9ACTN|nr:NTP transferase domain-containing protein [Streptantibioticus ferralitis]MDF2260798.1 NTP transferase domain-containing protein [Streptantibioticus ferralitis]